MPRTNKDPWQVQLHRGRYRRFRQVPPIHLRRGGVLPDGSLRPKQSTYPTAKMDRGLLNVAVLCYGNVHGMDYDAAHEALSEKMEKSSGITGVVTAGGDPSSQADNIAG